MTVEGRFGTSGVVTTDVAPGANEEWIGVAHTWDGKLVVSGYAGGDVAAGRYNAGIGLDQRVWVQQDADFNVTSIANDAGEVVERFRYTPYGERTVLNDDFTVDADEVSDYGFDLGHQGLKEDAETGLVYNRARYLHATLGRFGARDPLGYVDGIGAGSGSGSLCCSRGQVLTQRGLESWSPPDGRGVIVHPLVNCAARPGIGSRSALAQLARNCRKC